MLMILPKFYFVYYEIVQLIVYNNWVKPEWLFAHHETVPFIWSDKSYKIWL